MTVQSPHPAPTPPPRWPFRRCRAAIAGLLAAVGLATASLAQDGVLGDALVFDLPMPVERIYPAGPDLILATPPEASLALLVDARDGRIVGEAAFDGRLRSATAFVSPDSRGSATVALLLEPTPGRLLLRRLPVDADRGFGRGDMPDLDVPMAMADPAIAFLPFGRGGYGGGTALVIWDRSLSSGGGDYLFVWDAKAQAVGIKDYPAGMIPIGTSDWMLGLHPDTSRASVFEVLSGQRDDNVLVEGLRTDGPEALDSFVPGILYGGTGDALVANGSTRQLLALTAREGMPPLLDPPIRIALDALPTNRAGGITPWVAADRALSVILVGAVGTDAIQVMRRIRGGVASRGGLSLGLPVVDAIALHGPAPTDPERFALLAGDGRAIAIVKAAAFEAPPLVRSVAAGMAPPDDSPVVLNSADVAQIQRVLAAFGYPVGAIDGVTGPRTAAAVRAFQFDNGLEANGLIDEPTLDRLNAAFGDTMEGAPQEATVRAYADFLTGVAGAGDLAGRVMTLGASQVMPDHPCFGLNAAPPEKLWPNSVKFVMLLRRLEAELGIGVQVDGGYRSPAFNRCIEGDPQTGHQRFAAFDIRLADGDGSAEDSRRLLAALERLEQAGMTTFKAEPMAASVHVEPLLGEWHAFIASYSADERGCDFAREDVNEFAELLSGYDSISSTLKGREILVVRTRVSGHYAVTVDLNNDVAAAREASALIRRASALSRDRMTGSDSFVQQNSDWFLDPDCTSVRVIR